MKNELIKDWMTCKQCLNSAKRNIFLPYFKCLFFEFHIENCWNFQIILLFTSTKQLIGMHKMFVKKGKKKLGNKKVYWKKINKRSAYSKNYPFWMSTILTPLLYKVWKHFWKSKTRKKLFNLCKTISNRISFMET